MGVLVIYGIPGLPSKRPLARKSIQEPKAFALQPISKSGPSVPLFHHGDAVVALLFTRQQSVFADFAEVPLQRVKLDRHIFIVVLLGLGRLGGFGAIAFGSFFMGRLPAVLSSTRAASACAAVYCSGQCCTRQLDPLPPRLAVLAQTGGLTYRHRFRAPFTLTNASVSRLRVV